MGHKDHTHRAMMENNYGMKDSNINLKDGKLYLGNHEHSGTNPVISIERTVEGENAHGIQDYTIIDLDNDEAYGGFDVRCELKGKNDVDHFNAFQASPTLNNTHTVATYQGYSSCPIQNSGTITDFAGIKVSQCNKIGGIITNEYGIWVKGPYNNGATRSYGIWVDEAECYFGAGIMIPSTLAPAAANSAGRTGTIVRDANYLYVCTATNTWKRVAISTW